MITYCETVISHFSLVCIHLYTKNKSKWTDYSFLGNPETFNSYQTKKIYKN